MRFFLKGALKMFETNSRHFLTLFFLLLAVSFVFQFKAWGGTSRREEPHFMIIDRELGDAFSQPTPGNCILLFPIRYGTNSLAFSVRATFVVCHKGTTDVGQATKLYSSIYSHFVRKCNATRVLRPFLETFPLTPSQAKLCLRFDEDYDSICLPPKIAGIDLDNEDIISYDLFTQMDPEPFTGLLTVPAKDVPEMAPYYQRGCPRKVVDPKPMIPLLLSMPHPIRGSKPLFSFLEAYCKKVDLGLIVMGYVGPTWKDKSVYGFVLVGRQMIHLDRARKLASRCAKDAFDFIRQDKECLEQIKFQSTLDFPIHPSPTPVPEHVAFRISFWDENIDRPVQPYIAEIRYFNGVFKYYTADDVQKLVLVHQETFDEAMKFLEQKEANNS